MKQLTHFVVLSSLCQIGLRRRVGSEVATRLVLALVMSRLDYSNSLLGGLPQTTIVPLQRVQNAAVRLIFELGIDEHVHNERQEVTKYIAYITLAADPSVSPDQALAVVSCTQSSMGSAWAIWTTS